MVGWNYWLMWTIVISAEMTGVNTVLTFWTDRVPVATWLSLVLILLLFLNFFGIRGFGEVETIFTIIKFGFMFVIIVVCAVISAGAAPQGDPIGCKPRSKES